MIPVPALRQVVQLAADLPAAIATTRDFLGLHRGFSEEEGMAVLGFEHEVLAIDRTFVEIVAPLIPDSSPGRMLARQGESGYMVVVQVDDLDGVVERGRQLGISPVMRERLDGNPISQWHPRDLGTLAEIDQIDDDRGWHFCPELSDTGSTAVVSNIVGADVAVKDPAATAARWAALLGTSIPDGATTVPLAVGELRFIDMTGGGRGLASAEFARSTADPDRTGRPDRNSEPDRTGRSTTICGVRLTITKQESR